MNRKRRVSTTKWITWIMVIAGVSLILLSVVLFIRLAGTPLPVNEKSSLGISTKPVVLAVPVPTLELFDVSGNPVDLKSMVGQVVVLNHWATWCPPCKAEMPDLLAYYEAHKNQSFSLIAVDAGDPLDEVLRFREEYNLTFQVWLDPEKKALEAFKSNSLPSTFVIDREGIIRLAWIGQIDKQALDEYVSPMLED